MSQAGSNNSSGGTPPPTVATMYHTDSGPDAIPSLNILNIFGSGGISTSSSGNTVTITGTGSAFTWEDKAADFLASTLKGYFVTATATGTLPASPSQGNTIKFIVDNVSQVLTIQANVGQLIRIGNVINSGTGGTCSSTLQGDAISLVYRSADATWFAETGVQGSWTLS